jgi:hypothetical protein
MNHSFPVQIRQAHDNIESVSADKGLCEGAEFAEHVLHTAFVCKLQKYSDRVFEELGAETVPQA